MVVPCRAHIRILIFPIVLVHLIVARSSVSQQIAEQGRRENYRLWGGICTYLARCAHGMFRAYYNPPILRLDRVLELRALTTEISGGANGSAN